VQFAYSAVESRVLGRSPPPPFIGSRRGGYMYGKISGCVIFSPNRGEQWMVAVAGHYGAWRRGTAGLVSKICLSHEWGRIIEKCI